MKKHFDFFFSLIILIFFSPFIIIVMILIKLSDEGPVFFSQYRVGQNGLMFKLYKLRSMSTSKKAEAGCFDAGDNSRVTRIGSFIRKTKLDEIPQFMNVIKGDMSVVGPRPEVKKWVDAYPERWTRVLTVKPGITDPASIVYRNEEDILAMADDPEKCYREQVLPHKLDLYEEYVKTRTFWGDIIIIFKTLLTVVLPGRFSSL